MSLHFMILISAKDNDFFLQNAVEHAHAFILSPESLRFCEVEQYRNGETKQIFNSYNDSKVGTLCKM